MIAWSKLAGAMSPAVRARYREDQARNLGHYLPRICLIATPLVLGFWLVDLADAPEAAGTTLLIRLAWSAVLLGIAVLAFLRPTYRVLEAIGLIGVLASIAASVAVDVTGGTVDPMVVRVVLILVAACLLATRRGTVLLVAIAALMLPNLALAVADAPQRAWMLANAHLLAGVVLFATVCLSRVNRMRHEAELALALAAHQEEVERLARIDPLTKLWNRRHFFELAGRELARAERAGNQTMALMMVDIDRFKVINDTYGHAAGDEVLKDLARAWQGRLRRADLLARIGGEEFVILMPDTDRREAEEVAERLRVASETLGVVFQSTTIRATVSIGAVALKEGETLEAAMGRADKCLYEAKQAGRNRIVTDAEADGDDRAAE